MKNKTVLVGGRDKVAYCGSSIAARALQLVHCGAAVGAKAPQYKCLNTKYSWTGHSFTIQIPDLSGIGIMSVVL